MNMNVKPEPVPAPAPAPVEPKRRTITLTNRAPIQIVEDEWPLVTEGRCGWDHPSEDGTGWLAELRVRKGRFYHVIHANYDYRTDDGEDDQRIRVGRVILHSEAMTDLWKHMIEVGEELRNRIENENLKKYATYAIDRAFAGLKPVTY